MSRRRRGFTLMEVMITIAITTLVFAMVSAILFSVLNASELVHEKLLTEKTGYGCLALVRRDIEATYAYAVGAQAVKGDRATVGGKDADTIALLVARTAPPDEKGKVARFAKVAYKLASTDKNVIGLYRRDAPWNPGDDPLTGGDYSLVIQGIASFKLSYYDPKEQKWVEHEWKETDRIPRAVKIELDLARDAGREQEASSNGVDLPGLHFETIAGISALSDLPPPPKPAGP